MKDFFSSKKAVVAAGVAAAVTLGGGIGAFAYFASTGQGTGTATVGAHTDWAVTSDAATLANTLTPGGPTETVTYHVKNNSTGNQQLNKVTIQVATVNSGTSPNANPGTYTHTDGAGDPACTKGDFKVGTAAAGAIETQLPNVDLASGATYDGSVVIAMINRDDVPANSANNSGNQNSCENQAPPLFFAAS